MTDGLSDSALNLLATALAGEGRRKGLIVLTELRGGGIALLTGNEDGRIFGDEANAVWQARYELLDMHFIVEMAVDGQPAGYMVTPLGCLASGWQTGG